MKISESKVSMEASSLRLESMGNNNPLRHFSQLVSDNSLPGETDAFASFLGRELLGLNQKPIVHVEKSVEVTSKATITKITPRPPVIAGAQLSGSRFFGYVAGRFSISDTQSDGASLFGGGGSRVRKISLNKHYFETITRQLVIDLLVKNKKCGRITIGPEKVAQVAKSRSSHSGSSIVSRLDTSLRRERFSYEYQQMKLESFGSVITEDGRQINFDFGLNMTHSALFENQVTVRSPWFRFRDPLVFDLDGTGVGLSSVRFKFDLDMDGREEDISCLEKGCGFLAFDQNHDGIVNNGLELFGTVSGDGFSDLAQYDLDSNNWIDENDAIYNDLAIWMKDEAGNDTLVGLQDCEIGAICLASVDADFDLKDIDNNLNGKISRSGIYLKENGEVQSVHHVDMVTEEDEQVVTGEALEDEAVVEETENDGELVVAAEDSEEVEVELV